MPIVNNPGVGNCGFYAFGIGLIEIIQKEYHDNHSSPSLVRLNNLISDPINIEEILSFDLTQYAKNYQNYNRSFMDILQAKLRTVSLLAYHSHLFQEHIKDVEDPATRVEGTVIFNKFMEIVNNKLNKTKMSSNFNELVTSKEVDQIADSVFENLSFGGEKITLEELKTLDIRSQNLCLQTAAKNIFLADVFNMDHAFNPDSEILKASTEITKQGHWATHQDLVMAASQLGVNLNVNGQNNGENLGNTPTITLNNSSNIHWTTVVDSIPSLVQSVSRQETRELSAAADSTPSLEQSVSCQETRELSAAADSTPSLVQSVSRQETRELSPIAEKVLLAMVSAIESEDHKEKFKDFALLLIQYVENEDFKPRFKIDIQDIDNAQAVDGQSDEDFAQSLQEAEFIQAGLKPR